MSEFDKKEVEELETLCRIKLKDYEREEISIDLKKILDYAEELAQVNTDNVKPCNNVLEGVQNNVFREDVVKKTLPTDLFLENAPDKIGNMIKVPTIINQ